MATGMKMHFDTKEVLRMTNKLSSRTRNPMPLLKLMSRFLLAQTMSMFKGRRPDVKSKRGVQWPKLKPATIAQNQNMAKKGTLTGTNDPRRPMLRTGDMMDSVEITDLSRKGFSIETDHVNEEGFPYPAVHNKGRFPWLFIESKKEYAQLIKMTIDHLKGERKSMRSYQKGV